MSTEEQVDVPDHVIEYLGTQNTLTLATASPAGVPHASTFLYVNDEATLYFWTKPHTTTARHVEQNPVVAFAIDEYGGDLRYTKGVQGRGECSVILSGAEIARVADLFGQKFPDLSPGATMSISFFRVQPAELGYIDNTKESAASPEGTFGAEFHRERSYSVFDSLPLEPSDSIAAELQTVTLAAGETLVKQGGPADKFFIVVEGEVEVSRAADGGESAVTTLGPGRFFGEMAIIRDAPRSASVTATQPTTLFAMERDTFHDVVAQSLGTTVAFDEVIRSRLAAGSEA